MSRIAIDARKIYSSTGRYTERLLDYLQQIDQENQYFVLLYKDDLDRWQPTAKNFTKVCADYPHYTLREQLQFAWLLYRLRLDLVHFTMPQHPVLYIKNKVITVHDLILLKVINRRRANPFVSFYKYTVKPLLFKFVLRIGLATARHVIVPTDYVKQDILKTFGTNPTKITRTYEGIGAQSDTPEPFPGFAKERYIMYIGNSYPYKNLRAMIDAAEIIGDPTLEVVFVGKKDFFYEQLEEYSRSKPIKVHFLGFVPDPQMIWLLRHAQAYVFPSLDEGFGLPPLEAMAQGLPVVASNASCIPEVLGDAAVYFNASDPKDIADKVSSTLADKKLLAELKRKGTARATTFSWEKMAKQTLEVYKNALS